MDVIERLHECPWSIAEIAERAGLPWQAVDALVAQTMPGQACELPVELAERLARVLPAPRKCAQRPDGPQPLVGTRKTLPMVIVGSQPARVVAWLAAHDSGTTAELAAALGAATAKHPVCAMGSVLSRMMRETDLLRREERSKPCRYRLSPLGWRVADALARWRS